MKLSNLAVILSLTLLLTISTSQDPNTDGFFLSDFFTKMGHPLATTSSPVCTWTGVSCDAKIGRVTGLVLTGLGLTGPIPESTIGKLTKLQNLDLSNNNLTSLSLDIWELGSTLKTLNLSFNSITGTLPNNIGNFGELEKLDLSHNKFSGEIPTALCSITTLSLLNLGGNQFTGQIPDAILGCKSLISIDFSNNLIGGSVPNGFPNELKTLKMLNLGGNKFNGGLPDFSGLVSLTYLDLSSNSFQGTLNALFQKLTSLVYLDLSMNEFTGDFSNGLNQLINLKHLNLAFNKFSVQKFPSLEEISGLEYLNLSKASLTGQIPPVFAQLVSLKILDLSQNNITGQIPEFYIQNLEIIDISVNNLTGEIPQSLEKKLLTMKRFNFSYNNLTVCGPHFSLETYNTAFIGSRNDCPIAVNPVHAKSTKTHRKKLLLALALTLSFSCLVLGLIFLFIHFKRKNNSLEVKQVPFNEETKSTSVSMSGPFSFQTDSTTWVADIKNATSVPVMIFEKPLLNFTFADLLASTSNFDRGTLLAEGRFGPVYRGFLQGGLQVAIKVLLQRSDKWDPHAERELERLGRIKHPNLVPLIGYCITGEQIIAIHEYMENGNLHNLLHDLPLGLQSTEDWSGDTWDETDENREAEQNVQITPEGTATWRFRHKIALGAARALAYLHHGCIPQIIHRDVKASNIYFDSLMEPRLNFGLSMIEGSDPVEDVSNGLTGDDVFGFGVVLFELLMGKNPIGDEYPDSKETSLVSWAREMVKRNEGSRLIDPKIRETGSEKEMEEALRIGYLCTADLPLKRPSMQQVVGLLKDIEPKIDKDW